MVNGLMINYLLTSLFTGNFFWWRDHWREYYFQTWLVRYEHSNYIFVLSLNNTKQENRRLLVTNSRPDLIKSTRGVYSSEFKYRTSYMGNECMLASCTATPYFHIHQWEIPPFTYMIWNSKAIYHFWRLHILFISRKSRPDSDEPSFTVFYKKWRKWNTMK